MTDTTPRANEAVSQEMSRLIEAAKHICEYANDDYVPNVLFEQLRSALTAALSARASAGEGEPIGYVDPQRIHELKEGRLNIALFAERMGGNSLPLYAAAPQPAQAGAGGELRAWVGDMKTSAGMDYYVCVGRDTGNPFDRTYLTPHKYSIRGRAEYDVAQWNHLLGHGPKPDILAFDTQPTPASPATGED